MRQNHRAPGGALITLIDPFGLPSAGEAANAIPSALKDEQDAAVRSAAARKASGPCEVGQWGGLPADVMGVVAKRLAAHEAQAVTLVCRAWQQTLGRTLASLKPRNMHAVELAARYECTGPGNTRAKSQSQHV